jgi:GNAT superfamily N-acetyltransferase
VGVIHSKAGQVPGGRFGRAHLLRDPKGEAVAYTLTFENVAPPWDADRLLSLPPRLAHIYVRAQDRRRGIGTRMFGWWRDTFAVSVRLFAVDSPSEGMVGWCRLNSRGLTAGACFQLLKLKYNKHFQTLLRSILTRASTSWGEC